MQHVGNRCVLFLFRHGETDWNREGRLQGQNDTPLNATGLAQARVLAERLRAYRPEAVVSSDLSRALTTAQVIAETLRLPLITERGLREVSVGLAEGMLWEEAKARFGVELTERWYSDDNVAFPGGETGFETLTRGLAALRRFAERHPYRRIAVSTHGAMVRRLVKHALPPDAPPVRAHNAGVFILDYEPKTDRLVVIDDAELPEPFDEF
jgi:2,3-bisphosphoglycerate-dependent phosphoglycerate mutase